MHKDKGRQTPDFRLAGALPADVVWDHRAESCVVSESEGRSGQVLSGFTLALCSLWCEGRGEGGKGTLLLFSLDM